MSSTGRDRSNATNRDDCQIHVDKEGESCVIKIESVGQEKMLKEILDRMANMKNDFQQLANRSQSKELQDSLHDLNSKMKSIDDQIQKFSKNLQDDHRSQNDWNKKLDEIKNDFNELKQQQQKNNGNPEKMQQKLDQIEKQMKSSLDDGQKVSTKNDVKTLADAIQNLQNTIDKEKTKPDVLARKLDSIDQKLKDSQPEHTAMIKDLQTKIDPLHKSSPQTSETLMKIDDRIKALHSEETKMNPQLLQKLAELDQQLKQQNHQIVEPIKQILNEKLNPFIEQQKTGVVMRKDADDRLDRDEASASPHRVPLCVNGMIPLLSKSSDSFLLASLAAEISKKLDAMKNFEKENGETRREIANRTEPLQKSVENLSKQQQPIVDLVKDLPKKIDEILQKQNEKKDFSSQFDPFVASTKENLRQIDKKLDEILHNSPKQNEKNSEPFSQLVRTLKENFDKTQLDRQEEMKKLEALENRLGISLDPKVLNEIPKQIDSIRESLKKDQMASNEPIRAVKDLYEQMKNLDEKMKNLPEQISTKISRKPSEDDRHNLRQVPLSQSSRNESKTNENECEKANLLTNLLNLQTSMNNAENVHQEDFQPFLKRLEQSEIVQNDRDLNELVRRLIDRSNNQKKSRSTPLVNKEPKQSNLNDEKEVFKGKSSIPNGYLPKSRYIATLDEDSIRKHWPKFSSRSSSIVDAILNQPIQFDKGTNLDNLIKEGNLDQFASLTRNAIENRSKDYDEICSMMDSIVFDQMTMIGSREALIRPMDPSLLNRSSSNGPYPFPSVKKNRFSLMKNIRLENEKGNGRMIDRFPVDRNITLWMVETDETKPYFPSEFLPNLSRLNEKYDKIQHPQYNEIRQKRREDETRWNERYAFTRDNRSVLFVNDLRSYFMDYDTKRKYQVHDGVPINPVCRTGIAGRGDLPFWGPNHCVVVILLRNPNDPEVVLMRHHNDAFVLPKGFYGHEARYENQMKIVQDPVSGQILPRHLFDYWWSQVSKFNEENSSTNHLKRVLNEKELKEEFAEIFSQKGCNKSVFDNGYVDHPLNTDHAWVESSVWKIQFKDWRIPEMKSSKYSIANDEWKNSSSSMKFCWVKLNEALLLVPSFDRGLLVDVLASGMPI